MHVARLPGVKIGVLAACLAAFAVATVPSGTARADSAPCAAKKPKTKPKKGAKVEEKAKTEEKAKAEENPKAEEKATEPTPKPEEKVKPDGQAPAKDAAVEAEERRVEEAKQKLAVEGRKLSEITPGAASRWSNRGAMTPIVSEVPITAELPERAKPLAPGQETPGQALTGAEELLSMRFVVSGYHLETRGQDFVYYDPNIPLVPVTKPQRLPDVDRDMDLFRWRASMAYERIAGSDFGLHLDLEYRSRSNGSIPTDHRINELYASYGLTDFRGRSSTMDWGLAIGRVAIREAGYAQADGGALRVRFGDVHVGAFGGVSGNPYGYNWALHQTEEFSARWINAGAFVAYRGDRVFGNVAGVATLAGLGDQKDLAGTPGVTPGKNGLDRLFAFFDAGWLATEHLDVFLLGWADLAGGLPIQNIQAVVAYKAADELDLRFGLGRFATIVYESTTPYSFGIDEQGNKGLMPGAVVVDENNQPIVPFDMALQTAIYNQIELRAGHRFARAFDAWISAEGLLRDQVKTNQQTQATAGATVEFAALRFLPSAGARFHDPDIFDASAELTYIIDQQSQASMIVSGSLGREFFGLRLTADARHFFGDVAGTDGGLELSYSLPRDLMPGRLIGRAMLRYYREDLALARPKADPVPDAAASPNDFFIIPVQESVLGFASLEWRL